MLRRHTYDRTHPVRWIWSHARRHGWIILMMVIGAVGNAALSAVVPVLTGDAFNAISAYKQVLNRDPTNQEALTRMGDDWRLNDSWPDLQGHIILRYNTESRATDGQEAEGSAVTLL